MGKVIEFPYERIRVAKPLPDPLMEELLGLEKDLRELKEIQRRVSENFIRCQTSTSEKIF